MDVFVGSGNLSVSGLGIATVPTAKPLDWLLRHHDHNPQLIGTLEVATSVTIEIWEIVNNVNSHVSVASSSCYQIGNTGRWGWSTVNLPTIDGYAKHYCYIMTSNKNTTFEGQFVLNVPENAKWIHPRNKSEYLR